jgi:ABC-type nitrate/sulfonate/bicarbonate transport system substrate-binding protein
MKKKFQKLLNLAFCSFLTVILLAAGFPAQLQAAEKDVLNLSLDQWIGWRSILMANGGLETKKGSIFDKLDLQVNIKNIDDNDTKLNALMTNHIDAMGSTIQRYTFEFPKLKRARIPVKMIFITNVSSGGDGIIAKKSIKKVEELVGKRVALARFTEAQCLLEWTMMLSSLTPQEKKKIRDKIVFTEDAGKAGEIFFAKHADAAATWQPFLAQAAGSDDAHVLMDTQAMNNFILDGIIFREDYMKANPSAVKKFIVGTLEATDALLATPPRDPDIEYSYLAKSFPMAANMKKKEIEEMFPDAALSDYADNMRYLEEDGLAEQVFRASSQIWKGIGETANPELAATAFDSSALQEIDHPLTKKAKPIFTVTAAQRKAAQAKAPLISKQWVIKFGTGSENILPESFDQLAEFAVVAQMAEKTVVQIEGSASSDESQDLAEKRARAVASYLQGKRLDPSRLLVIGSSNKQNSQVDLTIKGIF